MMGSQHTYDLSAASLQKRKTTDGDIEADEMESGLSTAQLLKDKQQRADSTSEQQQAAKKRKTAEEAAGKKRFLKDFKF
jgi:hypothetical protein